MSFFTIFNKADDLVKNKLDLMLEILGNKTLPNLDILVPMLTVTV